MLASVSCNSGETKHEVWRKMLVLLHMLVMAQAFGLFKGRCLVLSTFLLHRMIWDDSNFKLTPLEHPEKCSLTFFPPTWRKLQTTQLRIPGHRLLA